MSYRMYMQIEQEKQIKAVDRYYRAGVKSVEEAEKLEARYWKQFCEDKSEKNQRLMHWSRSIVLGAKIISGEVRRWHWKDNDEYEHQDKLAAMGVDV
jgi:hypothetical protein